MTHFATRSLPNDYSYNLHYSLVHMVQQVEAVDHCYRWQVS